MPEPSDRDILIEVHTTVKGMKEELLGGPGRPGRIPQIEDAQKDHAARLNGFDGSFRVIVWILGFVILAVITVGGAFASHILGGKGP